VLLVLLVSRAQARFLTLPRGQSANDAAPSTRALEKAPLERAFSAAASTDKAKKVAGEKAEFFEVLAEFFDEEAAKKVASTCFGCGASGLASLGFLTIPERKSDTGEKQVCKDCQSHIRGHALQLKRRLHDPENAGVDSRRRLE
jgi:hypothetical protein